MLIARYLKQMRVEKSQPFLSRYHKEGQSFLDRIIAVDESNLQYGKEKTNLPQYKLKLASTSSQSS